MDDQPAGPYRVALARLDMAIAREIDRLRARYQLSLDEFRGLYVSDEHVDALIAAAARSPAIPRDRAASSERLAENLTDDTRWLHVVSRFSLGVIEQELLFLAVAAELNLKYETLFAYLTTT
jgi:hypothetical protein